MTAEELSELLTKMRPRMLGHLYGTNLRAHAEDLVQETARHALEALPSYVAIDAEQWLWKILQRGTIDLFRYQRAGFRDNPNTREPMPPEVLDTRQPPIDMEISDPIRHAFEALPTKYRDAVDAVVLQDMPYQEASRILDVPEGTVKSRVHRGCEQMWEELRFTEFNRDHRHR